MRRNSRLPQDTTGVYWRGVTGQSRGGVQGCSGCIADTGISRGLIGGSRRRVRSVGHGKAARRAQSGSNLGEAACALFTAAWLYAFETSRAPAAWHFGVLNAGFQLGANPAARKQHWLGLGSSYGGFLTILA